jgi:hypothetical protein
MIREAERALRQPSTKKDRGNRWTWRRSGRQITNLVGHGVLRRFRLPQVPMAERKVTKECESPATVPDDALE